MAKLVCTALGYEGATNTYVIEGNDNVECLKKLYIEALDVDEEDAEDELKALKRVSSVSGILRKLDVDFDTADFVLLTVYDADANKFLFKGQDCHGYFIK